MAPSMQSYKDKTFIDVQKNKCPKVIVAYWQVVVYQSCVLIFLCNLHCAVGTSYWLIATELNGENSMLTTPILVFSQRAGSLAK